MWKRLDGRAAVPTESAVSIFYGCRSVSFCLGLREKHWREHVRDMLTGIDGNSAPCFLLDPITARQFIDRGGFDTKAKLIRWAHETGRRHRQVAPEPSPLSASAWLFTGHRLRRDQPVAP